MEKPSVYLTPGAHESSGAWKLVGLLTLTAASSYLCRVNISITGAMMMPEFGISQIEMGRLFSGFMLGYTLFQVPAGLLADRYGARRVLFLSALWWVAGSLFIALLGWQSLREVLPGTVAVLFGMEFLLGVGEAPTFPAAGQGVARWVPSSSHGRANGLVIAGVAIGSALAPLLLSFVMVHWGWPSAIVVSAIPAMVVAIAWARVRESPRKAAPARRAQSGRSIRRFRWSRGFSLLTISYTLQGYVSFVFVYWFYLYLVQVRHFNMVRAGILSSLPWILSIVSIPLGGYLSDRLLSTFLGRRWGRRSIPIVALTTAAILVVAGARSSSNNAAVVCLTLAAALVLCVEGPFWATMMEIAGSRAGVAGGILNMGGNLGGIVSPALTPLIAAHFGWQRALDVAALMACVSACLWLGVSPAAPDAGTTTS
ncbi:MAG TPA: MFS transporter [Terriglobia bacterium]|nr:MFS transporter [Terriglobia bacterium]